MTRRTRSGGLVMVATLALLTLLAALSAGADKPEAAGGDANARPPERAVVFQPVLLWQGANATAQGTGFFVKAPGGKTAAVSSAHFIDRDGPPLMSAKWLDVRTSEPVASFTRSWGQPGDGGTNGNPPDLRTDYWIMPVDAEAPETGAAEARAAAAAALELDPRDKPALGEKVWLPNKNRKAKLGFDLVEGAVIETGVKYSLVRLTDEIELQSQSGSPIISQRTGKVIGTLSRGGTKDGTTFLLLAPSAPIARALADAKEFPQLRHVIGKHKR